MQQLPGVGKENLSNPHKGACLNLTIFHLVLTEPGNAIY